MYDSGESEVKMFKGVYVENNCGNNFSITDIVKTINVRDIETYVEQQMYCCQDQYRMSEIDDVIKSKVKGLVDELISQGYEIFNSGDFDSRQWLLRNQIEELQKHNKFLQHNVSQLQKQVNKLKQDGEL